MASKRLVSKADVADYEARLRAACTKALDAQTVSVNATLRQYGMVGNLTAAASPPKRKKKATGVATGAIVAPLAWNAQQWAKNVNEHIAPVARQVAVDAALAASATFAGTALWGMATSVESTTAAIIGRAVASGNAIGDRLDAAGVADDDVAKGMQAVLDTADDILANVVGAMGQAAATMASHATANALIAYNAPAYLSATKTWNNQGDDRVRESHQDVDDVQINELFSVGGDELTGPGDPSGSDEEVINCFPGDVLVDAPEIEVGYRRWYSGPVVKVETAGGHDLSGTPNHPVLTGRGWVPLGELVEGDHLVCGSLGQSVGVRDPHVADGPAVLSEVFGALTPPGDVERHVVNGGDFHGDGTPGEVEVVRTDRQLGRHQQSAVSEPESEVGLTRADEPCLVGVVPGPDLRAGEDALRGVVGTSSRRMGARQEQGPPLGALTPHPEDVRLPLSPDSDAGGHQATPNRRPVYPIAETQSFLALTSDVSLDEVLHVNVQSFSGHVYNLQTVTGWYIVNGFCVHNCRCWLTYDGLVPEGADIANEEPPDPEVNMEGEGS